MKKLNKVITLLLSLLLLTSCVESKPINDVKISKNNTYNLIETIDSLDGKKSIDFLKEYVVRKKNKNNTTDNEEFNSFLNAFFIDSMEEDYLTMHYTIVDYKEAGIEKPDLSVGEINYDDNSDLDELLELMKELHEFDYDTLSYSQQYDYECLEYSLIETIAYFYYQKYQFLYDGKTDILSNIITNFDEFVFYDEESINDYLVLLKDVKNYLEDTLVYTSKQAEDGIFLSDLAIDNSCDYIASFVSKNADNALILSFNSKIDEIDYLSIERKNELKEENKEIIINEIIPEFKKVSDRLKQYKGKTKNGNPLYKLNKDYAEITYLLATSNNTDIEKIFEYIKEKFDDMLALTNTAIYDQRAVTEYLQVSSGVIEPFNGDYEDIMHYLANNCYKCFPDVGKINYSLSKLDETVASDNVIAYYVPSPIDNKDQNTIRINPNSTGIDSAEDYFTLAHEGIPGHMYQYYYCQKNGIKPFRQALSFVGYQEGYACYAQNESLNVNKSLSEGSKNILIVDNFGVYILESIVDIGINYYGWSVDDVRNYLEECGYAGAYAQSMYNDLIDRYSVLCSYGIGYLYFIYLKDYAIDRLKERFDEVSFNEVILKNGQLPFAILKGAVDEYINDNK